MSALILDRAAGPWHLGMARSKLQIRGRLPGAFGFDLAADTYRAARRALPAADLVRLALPGSWMVNNKTISVVFQQWLQPGARDTWARVVDLLGGDSQTWLARTASERSELQQRLTLLADIEKAARGLPDQPVPGAACGLSKVLALLCPDTVPLMDDAALWFALDVVPRPDSADTPSATIAEFIPMLDWFARAVQSCAPQLQELAADYTLAPMSPAQILDRLLWFETWGFRVCRTPTPWWWVVDGEREAIVPAPGPGPAQPGARIDLAAVPDQPWRATVRDGLAAVFGPN